eukprot:4746594-Pyramimonas_sp.AAC.1
METTNRESEPSAPRGLLEAPRSPREAPKGDKGPERDPKRLDNDSRVSKKPSRASNEIPMNVHEASEPPPKHGGECAEGN